MKHTIIAAIAAAAILQGCVSNEQKPDSDYKIYGENGRKVLLQTGRASLNHTKYNLKLLDQGKVKEYESRHCLELKLVARNVMAHRQFTTSTKNGALQAFANLELNETLVPLAYLSPMHSSYSDSIREIDKFGNTVYKMCNK